MEHLVYWNCKEKNSALPKQINEFGDTVKLEDICAQLATIYEIVGDMSLDGLKETVKNKEEYEKFIQDWNKIAEIAGAVKKVGAEKAAEIVEAYKDGRCIVLPKVNMMSKKIFAECLEDTFKEWSYSDPSVGLYGMTDNERELADAIMNGFKKGKE